jgi:simple sugar transport system permease protein
MRWGSTYRCYFYVFVAGIAGLVSYNHLALTAGLVNDHLRKADRWAGDSPSESITAVFGSYIFGALNRLILDIQGPKMLLGLRNPFYYTPYWGYFLQMLPYAFTIIVLVIGSREAMRKRLGAPAALGTPYIRGERGL